MDYAGNSNKSKTKELKQQEKVVTKVVTGEVVQRKKSFAKKFKSVFFGGEFKAAASYVTADVILPSIRNMLADASKGAIDRVIYGESAYQRRRQVDYGTRVRYNTSSVIDRMARDPRSAMLPDQPPHHARAIGRRQDMNDIIIVDRAEAEKVLESLIDIVEQYDNVSLADLYELVGIKSEHTDNKWGWTLLSGAQVVQVREGYLLDLPPLEAL